MKVKDCMSDNVFFVKTDENIKEVAKLMSQKHIGCVPVCDNNRDICGIVTDRDILLRGVACNKDVNNTPISEIMSTNVCVCNQNEDINIAQNKMGINQIRRLPVCDRNNKLVGMLTLGNLSNNTYKIGKDEVCTTLNDICSCHKNKNSQ